MTRKRRLLRDGLLSVGVILLTFFVVLLMQSFFEMDQLIPMLFVLGVFLVSLNTEGYIWGIFASVLGVLAVNYAFMFPYYAIDLLTPVNLTTAVVMLAVSVMTSTLTTKLSMQQKVKAAAERERMRANLLRAISHDLRTPLTSIYGSCSLLLESSASLSEEKCRELLQGMRKESDWLIRMVENLLSVTRIDEKRMPVTKTPTVLEELIDSVLLKFRKHYPEQNVLISIPDEFVSIPMDAMLIEQVLINLLENAVVHAEGMTQLHLEVVLTEDSRAEFCVRDNGCGIPKARLSNLFTGYPERDEENSDGRRKGMGIGLYLCAAIIHAHGSRILARNLPEGGASFAFTLDLEDEHEQQ